MSDDIAEQVLELVKLMSAEVSALKDQVSALCADVRQLGQQMAVIAENSTRQALEMASIGVRLDRIEKHLEMMD